MKLRVRKHEPGFDPQAPFGQMVTGDNHFVREVPLLIHCVKEVPLLADISVVCGPCWKQMCHRVLTWGDTGIYSRRWEAMLAAKTFEELDAAIDLVPDPAPTTAELTSENYDIYNRGLLTHTTNDHKDHTTAFKYHFKHAYKLPILQGARTCYVCTEGMHFAHMNRSTVDPSNDKWALIEACTNFEELKAILWPPPVAVNGSCPICRRAYEARGPGNHSSVGSGRHEYTGLEKLASVSPVTIQGSTCMRCYLHLIDVRSRFRTLPASA
ncbi:uncharacterized protein LTR77_008689 [Saxophila tyrrhenica]|uniref:Uncharacterized protein n=1 Tax=Saxophila tyrrhenica TaxID=1690608 RepID=A0AAV9P2S9_9PEZI|nr:hypothetical protein LTR77_008689 [Saxophila tyrrhenica]